MTIYDKYETVVGLEIHAQLNTRSKAYCADPNEYGAMPNSLVGVLSLGHPGTLPKLNKESVNKAIRLGVACQCTVNKDLHFARKNYFYADLPKGYQITQDTTPICTGGRILVKDKNGERKEIRLTRIHMEEDAGKSLHDQDPFDTLIDLNRAGVPLVEIVTEPDIRSGEEAYSFVNEVRKLVRYLDVCDGNMEEGSLRCDANISVRLKGSKEYGQRAEIKNMNSARNVQRAIEHETKRQIDIIEAGGTIEQETRGFDAVNGVTVSQRSKEMAHDYRYFAEPDLTPMRIEESLIKEIKDLLPPLPHELLEKYQKEYGLSEYDATNLTENKGIALYYEEITQHTKNYKAAANWMMGSIKSYLNQMALEIEEFPLAPNQMGEIISLVDNGTISNTVATQKVFPLMLENPDKKAGEIVAEQNLAQDSNEDELMEWVEKAIAMYPEKVVEYKNGKKGLLGLFMGEVMKMSRGKADPKKANQLVRERLT